MNNLTSNRITNYLWQERLSLRDIRYLSHYTKKDDLDGDVLLLLLLNESPFIELTDETVIIRELILDKCEEYIQQAYKESNILKQLSPIYDGNNSIAIQLQGLDESVVNIDLSSIFLTSYNYSRASHRFKNIDNSVIYEYSEYISITFDSWNSLLEQAFG